MVAAVFALANPWAYVTAAYGLAIVLMAAYAAWTVVRGRRLGRQLPPGERRWM